MKFIEKIRSGLEISKYEFSKRIGITPQAYYSLEQSSENISLKALVGIRRAGKVSDKALLDMIEDEWSRTEKSRAHVKK